MCFSPVIQASSGPAHLFCRFTCQSCLDDATLQASPRLSPDRLTPASESLLDVCTLNIRLTFVSKGEKQGTDFLATVNVRPDPTGLCPERAVRGFLELWLNDCIARLLHVCCSVCEWGSRCFLLATPCSLWGLRSPTRDPTREPAVKALSSH